MIGLLHGYQLEGSGSNLWTRSVARALCGRGVDVALFCQERHPERYDFIARAVEHAPDGAERVRLERDTPYPGRCTLHRPRLGPTLPVYVWDVHEGFERAVPMTELPDADLDDYLEHYRRVLARVLPAAGVRALVVNHVAPLPCVARDVTRRSGLPYAVMPHGSAIEYAVKRDGRFHRMAARALADAACVFAIGDEIRSRLAAVFPDVPGLAGRLRVLPLGVDTAAFRPIARGDRRAAADRLTAALTGLPRGRSGAPHPALVACLDGPADPEALRRALRAARDYDAKCPDADLEARLATVDWERERLLLFVGRLIAAKGLQAVVAALPTLLERTPDLRVLAVGHGPLREVLEALLRALAAGRRDWVETIADRGVEEEAGSREAFAAVRAHLAALARRGEADAWWERAARHVRPERVLFTGYLTHAELRFLFPCCDAAVFPSLVAEAGPLVFLEALAAGCFPLGVSFGGMAASIDAAARALPETAAAAMRLSPEPDALVGDVEAQVPRALAVGAAERAALRDLAVARHDWSVVADRLVAAFAGGASV